MAFKKAGAELGVTKLTNTYHSNTGLLSLQMSPGAVGVPKEASAVTTSFVCQVFWVHRTYDHRAYVHLPL